MELKLLGKEEILTANDRETRDIPVPEWGGIVRVQSLTAIEYETFQNHVQNKMQKGKVDLRNVTALLISKAVIDENGKAVFTADDVTALSKKSSKAINRVWKVVQEMNGIGTEDIEELVGNSSGIQDDGGGIE